MKTTKTILALFILQILCLLVPQSIFCQKESLGIFTYNPPKGWTKTEKEGALVYVGTNQTINGFCILTVYETSQSTGNPETDFTNQWKALVVKPFKGMANPKTESQTDPVGWQAMVGGSEIEIEGGKAIAILTVFSGFGKTASVLAIVNDEGYLAKADAFIAGIQLENPNNAPFHKLNPAPTNQISDPYPDIPGYAPQEPLLGTLKGSISMEDLTGTWGNASALVQDYVDSTTGNYSGTDTTLQGEQYFIKPDSSFSHKSIVMTSNGKVRETNSGTVILSNDLIIFKFNDGSTTMKYQLIGYMTLPNGRVFLSLIPLGENENGKDAEQLRQNCGHSKGIIRCVGGEVWERVKPGN